MAPNSVINMAAGRDKDWRNFQKKMTEKRVTGKEKKAKGKGAVALPDDTITVQRLSAEVTGKLQKYSRIGARVFVSYEFEEYTIENIKSACMKHFGIPEDGILCCDVLAGEQGPSCFSVKQIPDFKVIHVRFIERSDGEGEPETKRSRPVALQAQYEHHQLGGLLLTWKLCLPVIPVVYDQKKYLLKADSSLRASPSLTC